MQNAVGQTFVFQTGKCNRRSFLARSLNLPLPGAPDQSHLTPLPPPVVDFPGERNPYILLAPQPAVESQKALVCFFFPRSRKVIRMHDDINEAVLPQNEIDLLLP